MKNRADFFAEIWVRLEQYEYKRFPVSSDWSTQMESEIFKAIEDLGKEDKWFYACTEAIDKFDTAIANCKTKGEDPTSENFKNIAAYGIAIDSWYSELRYSELNNGGATEKGGAPDRQIMRGDYLYYSRLDKEQTHGRVVLRQSLHESPLRRQSDKADLDLDGAKEKSTTFSPRVLFNTLLYLPTSLTVKDPDKKKDHDAEVIAERNISFNFFVVPHDLSHRRAREGTQPFKIGFAPIATTDEHLKINLVNFSDGSPAYDVVATTTNIDFDCVIGSLCQHGCNIICFPEMVIHPESLPAIERAIKKYGPESDLALVVAGSHRAKEGSTPPANEAILYNHFGKEILRQRKLHRWNLDTKTCERFGIQAPEKGRRRFEFISPGTDITLVEIQGIGRIAILICEDHARREPGDWLRKHAFLDLQIVPVLDGHLDRTRWQGHFFSRTAKEEGVSPANIIVANSLPLTLRSNGVIKENNGPYEYYRERCGIAICASPGLGVEGPGTAPNRGGTLMLRTNIKVRRTIVDRNGNTDAAVSKDSLFLEFERDCTGLMAKVGAAAPSAAGGDGDEINLATITAADVKALFETSQDGMDDIGSLSYTLDAIDGTLTGLYLTGRSAVADEIKLVVVNDETVEGRESSSDTLVFSVVINTATGEITVKREASSTLELPVARGVVLEAATNIDSTYTYFQEWSPHLWPEW